MRIPPKNYYPDLNRRKNGLDTAAAEISALEGRPVLPTPGDGDLGKVPKVNAEGGYTLAADEGLPAVTSSDNTKMLQVVDGAWDARALTAQCIVQTSQNGYITATSNVGLKITKTSDSITRAFLGVYLQHAALVSKCLSNSYTIQIDDEGTTYKGFVSAVSSDIIYALVTSDGINLKQAVITASSISYYTPTPDVLNVPITIDGLTGEVTMNASFSDIYNLLDAGKVVKFIEGADVYVVHDFTNVGIKAYCFDLDLLDLYVKEISIPSTGPGTYTMVTFTGTT